MTIALSGRETLLTISFALAASAVLPWFVGNWAILLSFIAAPTWLVLGLVILVRHRLRDLWVLLGLPLLLVTSGISCWWLHVLAGTAACNRLVDKVLRVW